MKKALIALFVSIVAAGPSLASDKSDVVAVVSQWVGSFNQGDMKALLASCADQAAIIDEFPPYEWHGTGACARWSAAYDADARSHRLTNGLITLSDPIRVSISDGHAYVVVPAKFDFRLDGKANSADDLIFTVVLQKAATVWRTTGWAWAQRQ